MFFFWSSRAMHCVLCCECLFVHVCVFTVHALLDYHQAHFTNPPHSFLLCKQDQCCDAVNLAPFIACTAQGVMWRWCDLMCISWEEGIMSIKHLDHSSRKKKKRGVGLWGDLRGRESLVALHMLSSGRTLKLSPAVKRLGKKHIKCHSNKPPGTSAACLSEEGTACLI